MNRDSTQSFNIAAHIKAEQSRDTICPAGRRHQLLRQAAAAQLEMQWQLVSAAQPAASQNKTPSAKFPAGSGADVSDRTGFGDSLHLSVFQDHL